MKKTFTLFRWNTILFWILFMGLALPVRSQITIPNTVFPSVGDKLLYATDNQPNGIIMTPPGGPQQWDFSNLTPSATWVQEMKDPQTGAGQAFFPDATIVYDPQGHYPIRHFPGSNGVEAYLKVTNNEVAFLGYFGGDPLGLGIDLVNNYNPPIVTSRAPVNFFDINQTSSGLLEPFDDQLMPPDIRNKLPFQADSFRIRIAVNRIDAVDAFGSLTIPGGTFEVLRQKRTQYQESRIDAKINPLGWLDVTDVFIQFIGLSSLGVDTLVTFHFLNDQSKEPIAVCTTDNSQLRVISVQYKDLTPPACTPSITIMPGTGQEMICSGGAVNLAAMTTGCTDGVIQWQAGNDGQNFADIPGATGMTLAVSPSATTYYRATFDCNDSNNCPLATSDVVMITVIPDPAIAIRGATTACPGEPTELSAQTNSGTGDCTIQWQHQKNNEWVDLAGETGPVLTMTPLVTTNYRAIYSCTGSGCLAVSNVLTITIENNTTIVVETNNLTFCAFSSPPNNCDGQVDITFRVDDDCAPDLVEVPKVLLDVFNAGNPVDLTGQVYTVTPLGGSRYQISGQLVVGEHTFIVSMADGGGNLHRKRIEFEVKDCKSPVPICVQILPVELMPVDLDGDGTPDGGVDTVSATDYVASDINDCSPFDTPRRVKYFVFKDSELPTGPEVVTLEDLTDEHELVIFTCDEVNSSVITYLFALDAAGNFGYCAAITNVNAGNPPTPCGNGDITGLITNESDDPVAGVDVQLRGHASLDLVTDDNGNYSFPGLFEGYDYSVTPSLDKDYLNGVSTLDLMLIARHILGDQPLDSPYKLIAADVSNSHSITALDLILLRRLILNLDTKFANNKSWRFVPADYTFPDPADPWTTAFPEALNITNLSGQVQGDFMAIKLGDVNNDAAANGLMDPMVRSTAGTFELNIADEDLTAGEEYTIPVTSNQLAGIYGFQGTLTFDRNAVELVDIVYGLATQENFGVFAADGLITMSWNRDSDQGTANSELFSLVLRARTDTRLSEALSIGSRLTRAEAYSSTDAVMDIALVFELPDGLKMRLARKFELYQNTPNPFQGQTVIGFNLPAAADATIKVSDVQGRMLKRITGQFREGYNEIRLNSADLNAAGLLYYTVGTAKHTATRKMIVIE